MNTVILKSCIYICKNGGTSNLSFLKFRKTLFRDVFLVFCLWEFGNFINGAADKDMVIFSQKWKAFIPLHSRDYLNKNSMKTNVVTDEDNSRNEMWHWTNDEIGVAVQSWLWVRVELMAWKLSRLERLNGIQWSWVQVPLRPTFYSYFKESFGDEYHFSKFVFSIFKKNEWQLEYTGLQ